MQYFIGLDVGTTGSKAILINEQGKILATHTAEYPMFTPKPLWTEQNPEDWWRASCEAFRAVVVKSAVPANDIKGIGLTGQMHGLVILDREGHVLRPCIMWNDQRTSAQCAAITKKIGFKKLMTITGNPVLPGFTAPKIQWVRDNEPKIFKQIKHILLPKDYIKYRLTGVLNSDVSDAAGTSLLDVGQRCWSEKITTALGIPLEWLPEVTESAEVIGQVTPASAADTGLFAGTPVVAGAGDQAAGAVGSGTVQSGVISVCLGTSGVVFAHTNRLKIEPQGRLHAFCHAVPGNWHLMGVTLSAGGSFRWYRDTFAGREKEQAARLKKDVYEIITESAASVPAGAEGLLFLPYLTGERTPYPDPNARGIFYGITVRHGKDHFARAVLEGVAFSLMDCLQLIKDLGTPVREIRTIGGGARSMLWRQIIADIFNRELLTLTVSEGAPFGAALLAGVGTGCYKNVASACSSTIQIETRTQPVKKNVAVYRDAYPLYRQMYGILKETYSQTAHFVEKHTS
jgi:xylulokinase